MAEATQQVELKSATLLNLYKRGLWKTVSGLNFNKSEYPFVTFLNSKGRAANVYMGRKTAEIVKNTFKQGDNLIGFLKDSEIVMTENSKGEIRFKVSRNNGSNYASLASIEESFGQADNSISNFDEELWKKEFYKDVIVENPVVETSN